MNIIIGTPPNWKQIKKAFNPAPTVVITYGDTVYMQEEGLGFPDHLRVHEETHEEQQRPLGPKLWWDKYITDVAFRLGEEAEAYHNQYLFYCQKNHDRNKQALFLYELAKDLAGKTYDYCISYVQAVERIKNG